MPSRSPLSTLRPAPRPAALAAVAAAALAAATSALAPSSAGACTTFRIRSQDGAWIVGRSMELGMPLQSQLMVVPRGLAMSSTRPDLKPGTAWTTRYGFVGMNALHADVSNDGMNEAGLSVGTLYFPGFVGYQPFPADGRDAISNLEFSNWVLGRFATVEEVKAALPKVVVYDLTMPPAGPQPLHWAISDAKGGSIVVEYVGGTLFVHENPIGVLTNSPPFDWHMTNLRNHVNLTNLNVEPLRLGTVEIQPIGQGSGLLGIPGDYTPPSRFVRATALAFSSAPVATAKEGVNLAFHILNAVDIPIGAVAEKVVPKDGGPAKLAFEQTQWATVHDLQNRTCYFRTYGNLAIRKVDLGRLDFTGKRILHVPVSTEMQVDDLTAQAR